LSNITAYKPGSPACGGDIWVFLGWNIFWSICHPSSSLSDVFHIFKGHSGLPLKLESDAQAL
jgi:hypothetical protein